MIGNDLVYFSEWPRRKGERLQRFRAKVFTVEEIKILKKASAPYYQEALYWSIKEAVYKSWHKQSHQRLFNPRKIQIQRLNETSLNIGATVEVEGGKFLCHSFLTTNFIYSFARPQGKFQKVHHLLQPRASENLRFYYQGQVLEISKTAENIPVGKLNGQKLDMSITHAGGFSAFAFC